VTFGETCLALRVVFGWSRGGISHLPKRHASCVGDLTSQTQTYNIPFPSLCQRRHCTLYESMLRLLVPEDIDLPSYGQLNIGNDAWKVINGDRWVQDGKKYICISYAWGNKKVPNTLYGGANIMSSRTMDVLNVALRTLKGQELLAIYLDAFCLPPTRRPVTVGRDR
jgi:hypothetical protein